MNLIKLMDRLSKEDRQRKVTIGFGNPHSYRGDYSKLGFEPEIDSSIFNMLSACAHALGHPFEGYKGGTYRMDGYTECYLAHHGQCGIEIDEALLDRLLMKASSDESPDGEECPDCNQKQPQLNIEIDDCEELGYILAMRLLQSDLVLDDKEVSACARFTQPRIIRRMMK